MAQILLIEPDRVLAGIYAASLKRGGHEVTTCSGAQAAIMAADQIRPDVVLVELQLIEHSGIEFLYEFRSYPEWQGIPVVIQSHVPQAEFTGSQSILNDELGIKGYLYKPRTSLKQMLAAVNQQLAVAA
jgi:DNA-binding response OmpR family regulator